jgi:hypothetical protein
MDWRLAESTAENPNPRPNPLDAEPTILGNIQINENGRYKVLTKFALEVARTKNQKLYTSHFATCPNAKKFRSKK